MKYSIVQQPNQKGTKFTVDEETGEVSTNKVFDREGDDGKFVSVTVKATDQGEPSLEGVCSFTVEITDVNDNPPLFDRQVSGFLLRFGGITHTSTQAKQKLATISKSLLMALIGRVIDINRNNVFVEYATGVEHVIYGKGEYGHG